MSQRSFREKSSAGPGGLVHGEKKAHRKNTQTPHHQHLSLCNPTLTRKKRPRPITMHIYIRCVMSINGKHETIRPAIQHTKKSEITTGEAHRDQGRTTGSRVIAQTYSPAFQVYSVSRFSGIQGKKGGNVRGSRPQTIISDPPSSLTRTHAPPAWVKKRRKHRGQLPH